MLRYYGYSVKTVSQGPLFFSSRNHGDEMVKYSEFELYLQDKHFETIASQREDFVCLPPVEL